MKNPEVMNIVKSHLQRFINPIGGIHIGKRPKGIRLDVVELNVLVSMLIEKELKGVVNINSYHEDAEFLEELTEKIIDIIDSAYIEEYLFNFDKQYYFKVSRTLIMSNVRVGFTKQMEL